MVMGVYAITNKVSGKMYVGSAYDIDRRWSGHKSELRHNHHHSSHLQRAWNKYGEDAFFLQILEVVKEVAKVREAEQRWIDFLGVYGKAGYNAFPRATGGRLAGWRPSEATLLMLRNSDHARGENNVHAKLTAEDVKAICARLNADEGTISIARDFGVGYTTIDSIRCGHTWQHISAPLLNAPRSGARAGARHGMAKLTESDVKTIKRRLSAGERHEDIAKDFSVRREAISKIAQGRRWQHVKEE